MTHLKTLQDEVLIKQEAIHMELFRQSDSQVSWEKNDLVWDKLRQQFPALKSRIAWNIRLQVQKGFL